VKRYLNYRRSFETSTSHISLFTLHNPHGSDVTR